MNETELIEKWDTDRPVYEVWGNYVLNSIRYGLSEQGKNLDIFLKIPPSIRLKSSESLVDKAFYRPGKAYDEPYEQIEDKVGMRFVVLLVQDIEMICSVIEDHDRWTVDRCRHFAAEREKDPLLFTYQSVHYVVRPRTGFTVNKTRIPSNTPCEIQVRTLLQHAHAELTHDAIYKAKRTIKPTVHRTVAKSMALIETTDDFFSTVTRELNHGPLEEHAILERLDSLYRSFTELEPYTQKSSLVIWDAYEQFIESDLIEKIQEMVRHNTFLAEVVRNKYGENVFYQQSTVLFVFWMLERHKRRLLQDWPLSREALDMLAVDIGVSLTDGE